MMRNNSSAYHERDQGRPLPAAPAAPPVTRTPPSSGPIKRAASRLSIDAPPQAGAAAASIDSALPSTIYRNGNRFSDTGGGGATAFAPRRDAVSKASRMPAIDDLSTSSQPSSIDAMPASSFGKQLAAFQEMREIDRANLQADRDFRQQRSIDSFNDLERRRAQYDPIFGPGEPANRNRMMANYARRVMNGSAGASGKTFGRLFGPGADWSRNPEPQQAVADIGRLPSSAFDAMRKSAIVGLEQQQGIAAGLANQFGQKRQALLDRIDELPTTSSQYRATVERLAALDGNVPAQETFSNPVDEIDADGTPIRAQYGNRGTRQVIDGARPMPRSGGGISVGPDGALSYTGGSPKLTDQQSKDLVYFTRGTAALENMEGRSDTLANPMKRAASAVPFVGNALAGGDYQQAEQAGREFLASVLRKDTGAAIARQEMDTYGKTYLPQPFDTPETLQQKAQARATALEAIKSGMGPAQQLVPEQSGQPQQGTNQPPVPEDPAHQEFILESERRRAARRRQLMDGFDAMSAEGDARIRGIVESQRDYSSLWE